MTLFQHETKISNEAILSTYLTEPMRNYFYKKLKNESHDYINLKICELLKFLLMSQYTYGDIPFDEELDEMWHLWILQTIQYSELMDKLPEKKFINHCSNDYTDSSVYTDEKNNNDEKISHQLSYLASYVANFGTFTDNTAKFWVMTKNLMQTLNLNLAELNALLLSLGDDNQSNIQSNT